MLYVVFLYLYLCLSTYLYLYFEDSGVSQHSSTWFGEETLDFHFVFCICICIYVCAHICIYICILKTVVWAHNPVPDSGKKIWILTLYLVFLNLYLYFEESGVSPHSGSWFWEETLGKVSDYSLCPHACTTPYMMMVMMMILVNDFLHM